MVRFLAGDLNDLQGSGLTNETIDSGGICSALVAETTAIPGDSAGWDLTLPYGDAFCPKISRMSFRSRSSSPAAVDRVRLRKLNGALGVCLARLTDEHGLQDELAQEKPQE
jgi:hypothetical protein